MIGNRTRFIIVFLFFLFSSQWFLILIQNNSLINFGKPDLLFGHKQLLLDETNSLRGETIANQKSLLGKLFVNKISIYGQEMSARYLESFDANYLFFTGGIDRITSTGNVGQMPLIFLPLIIFGFLKLLLSKNRHKYFFLGLIILSPALSVFFFRHYEWVPKVLFFFALTALSAFGFIQIPKKNKLILALITFIWLFEYVDLYHKFKNHYIENLSAQIYNIKR